MKTALLLAAIIMLAGCSVEGGKPGKGTAADQTATAADRSSAAQADQSPTADQSPAAQTDQTATAASSNQADPSATAASANRGASSATAVPGNVSFTQGKATPTDASFPACRGGRVTAQGEIKSEDGADWMVPSDIDMSLPAAGDLANPCANVQHASLADVNLDDIPVVEIDPDGEVVTGYIFADNYFELYVNGKAVAKDAVVYTPFNSSIVRFKAKYPMTYAIKAVDWEENLGLGTEDNRGDPYYYGDAGIVAVFSDGTVTDQSWAAQNFYIAPLMSKDDLVVKESDGKQLRTSPDYAEPPECDENCYAAHFALPDNWIAADFDDSSWPRAKIYSEQEVGVDNKREYTDFADEFGKGKFVWTGNLKLDNEILLRHTTER